jgi:UDP-glucose 4-epimerase
MAWGKGEEFRVNQPRATKFLVTGARGFIGSNLCESLLREGAEVHALSQSSPNEDARPSSRSTEPGMSRTRWWSADLTDPKDTERLLHAIRPEVVFHLAGLVTGSRDREHVLPMVSNHLLSTLNLLNAVADTSTSRLVLAGSIEVPGPDDTDSCPSSPYAAAKWASASYASMFNALYKTPAVVARMSMVYGPRQWDKSKLVPYVIQCLLRGERPRLGSGKGMVDWIYVGDVVAGLRTLAEASGIEGQTIDLGSGALTPIRDVVQHLVSVVNSKIEPEYGALQDRPLDPEHVADVSETTRLVGWAPVTSLSEGLERTVAWYRDQYRAGMAAAS